MPGHCPLGARVMPGGLDGQLMPVASVWTCPYSESLPVLLPLALHNVRINTSCDQRHAVLKGSLTLQCSLFCSSVFSFGIFSLLPFMMLP